MPPDPFYVPSSIQSGPYQALRGDHFYPGVVKSHEADKRTYTITCGTRTVIVIVDIYLSLKEKFVPGQEVMVTMNELDSKFARNVRSMTEAEKAKSKAESSQSPAGQAGSSQSQAGSSQPQGGS